MSDKPSAAWYLAPIFLGIIGIFFLLALSTISAHASMHDFKILPDVGVPGTDETFDISYQVQRNLVEAEVEILRKSITFTFAGKISDDKFLVILPQELIQGPFSVWSDKTQITIFDVKTTEKTSILTIPLFHDTEQVIIVGSKIAGTFNPKAHLVINYISGTIDKAVYVDGDTIEISGKVSNPKSLGLVVLSVLGPKGNTIILEELPLDSDLKFMTSMTTGGLLWPSPGIYTIKITGKDANTFSEKFDFVPFILPDWLKRTAEWWSQDQIDDSTFATGIQYLIKENIIVIPDLPEETQKMELQDEKRAMGLERDKIPEWVKNNAGWWADGLISDDDFINGIKYMVENGIIRV